MQNNDTGILIVDKDVKLHRKWFEEMTKLIGIKVLYRSPKGNSKNYDLYGELDANYNAPIPVGCIFDEHPNQWTMKKLGWNSELSENLSIIHVPYDLELLQSGCLFIVPSGLDQAKGRLFKVIRMSNIAVYPASIACEIGPVFENNCDPTAIQDFTETNYNVLNDNEEDD